jgi:hypothetical protein
VGEIERFFTEDEKQQIMSFSMPPKGSKYTYNAYERHVGRGRAGHFEEKALKQACEYVAKQRGKRELIEVPHDECGYREILALVRNAVPRLRVESSPGLPLSYNYQNTYDAMEAEGEEIIYAAVARLQILLDPTIDLESLVDDPMELLMRGIIDPQQVFTKEEPHPKRKADLGHFRSISGISLIQNLVESVLFHDAAEVLKVDKFTNGSAIGISFTDVGMKDFSLTVSKLIDEYGLPTEEDVAGFDATHTVQTYEASCYVDELVYWHKRGLKRWNLANRRWALLSAYAIVLLGGIIYSKTVPGVLNSGSRDTSRRNTLFKLIYSAYFCIIALITNFFLIAAGDDGCNFGITDLEKYQEAAKSVNITLREVRKSQGKKVNFCSHEFNLQQHTATLTSWPKAVYRILCMPNLLLSDALQIVDECRHNTEVSRIRAFILALNLPIE